MAKTYARKSIEARWTGILNSNRRFTYRVALTRAEHDRYERLRF